MRISDGSSDVCSSDLSISTFRPMGRRKSASSLDKETIWIVPVNWCTPGRIRRTSKLPPAPVPPPGTKDRKRVVSGQSVSVRVDLGVRRHIKTKTHNKHINTTHYSLNNQ